MKPENRITLLDLPFEPRVWMLDLTDPEADAAEVNWLSEAEMNRYNEFGDPQLAAAFRLRRGLARFAISETVDQEPAAIPLGVSRAGQPLLPGWGISFSSSRDRGLVALSSVPVGVDLEWERPIDFEPLLKDHFSEAERELVEKSADPRTTFYQFWARKEAIGKAAGTGIGDSMAAYSCLGRTELPGRRYESANFNTLPGFIAALARLV